MHGGNVWEGSSPEKWLDFSANLRPEGAPDWVYTAISEGIKNLGYYPDPQMRLARASVAEYLDLPEEYVWLTAGGISAIRMTDELETGEKILLTPCFSEYEQFSRGKIRKVCLLNEKREIKSPDEALDQQLTEKCLVWLCNPMNPIGIAFDLGIIENVLRMTEAVHGYLAVDEAFIEYCSGKSARSLLRDHSSLIITGSMTKVLGVPGIRLGYVCAAPETLNKIKANQITWELNCCAESIACDLPNHRREIEADAVLNAARREDLRAGLETLGFYVYPSEASFLLLYTDLNAEKLISEMKKHNILIRSCISFDGLADGHHLRIAVKDTASNAILIQRFREVVKCVESH